jgi:peptidoglycan hydrolase-like protein with peptidoglycan-binding domain
VATPVAPASPAAPKARPTLKVGSKHAADVKYVQKKLGVATGGADGIFGPKTKAAVIAFQKKHGLTADGIIGPKTWAKLG